MITTQVEVQEIAVPVYIQCDRCKTIYSYDTPEHQMEIQEFLRISMECGYNSIFGDESFIEADICQYCLQELIGSFVKVS